MPLIEANNNLHKISLTLELYTHKHNENQLEFLAFVVLHLHNGCSMNPFGEDFKNSRRTKKERNNILKSSNTINQSYFFTDMMKEMVWEEGGRIREGWGLDIS